MPAPDPSPITLIVVACIATGGTLVGAIGSGALAMWNARATAREQHSRELDRLSATWQHDDAQKEIVLRREICATFLVAVDKAYHALATLEPSIMVAVPTSPGTPGGHAKDAVHATSEAFGILQLTVSAKARSLASDLMNLIAELMQASTHEARTPIVASLAAKRRQFVDTVREDLMVK
ncbi:MAG: hypothetical protein JWM95_1412 [Gemmatimonadetes bacterium]|nr:hypothetical protein [Gemmatimonadota bacterium]